MASPKEAPREIRPGAVGGAAAGSGGVYDGPSRAPCVPPCAPSRSARLSEKAFTSCCFHDAPRASCGPPPGGPPPSGPAGRVAASGPSGALSGARCVKSAASIARRDSVSETESEGSRETSISPVRPVEVPLTRPASRIRWSPTHAAPPSPRPACCCSCCCAASMEE